MKKLWSDGKSSDEIFLAESVEAVVNLHEDVLCLREDLRLANMLINKINDKKYKQMVATYRILTKAN